MQKALLYALLLPNAKLKALQDAGDFTEKLMLDEEMKTYLFTEGDISHIEEEGAEGESEGEKGLNIGDLKKT